MAIKTKTRTRTSTPKTTKLARRAAPAAEPGPAAAPPLAGELRQLPHASIVASSLNPRKSFDDAEIAALAASIADKGLLQNLVVRPHPAGKGHYEIVAGERRHRAIGHLIETGRWPVARTLPVLVCALDDRAALELAIVENVKRQDLSAMEEARGYAALRDLGLGTDDIAARVAMSRRHVQERLALADKLAPAAQAALEAGEISIAQARMLKLGTAKEQEAVLAAVIRYATEPRRIYQTMVGDLPKVNTAHFALDLYDGAFVDDPDDVDMNRRFADKAQFLTLQSAAIEATREKLGRKWAWVEVHENYFSEWQYTRSKDRAVAGAVIVVGNRGVEVKTGYVRPKAAKSGGKAGNGAAAPKPDFTKKHLFAAHQMKTIALQNAVARDVRAAKVMTCFALLTPGHQHVVSIRKGEILNEDHVLSLQLDTRLDRLRKTMGVSLFAEVSRYNGLIAAGGEGPDGRRAVYRAVRDLADADLDALFAALVASRVGSFCGYTPQLGDEAVAVALAEDLGVDMAEALPLSEDYLKLAGKERLVEMLDATGECDAAARKQLLAKTGGTLRAMVMHEAARVLPRELRFGSTEDLSKAKAGATGPRQLDLVEAAGALHGCAAGSASEVRDTAAQP